MPENEKKPRIEAITGFCNYLKIRKLRHWEPVDVFAKVKDDPDSLESLTEESEGLNVEQLHWLQFLQDYPGLESLPGCGKTTLVG